LRYLVGEHQIKESSEKDLEALSDLLEEGEEGITTRDAFNWLKDSLNFVRKNNPQGGGTLTVEIAFKILKRKLAAGEMAFKDNTQRMSWLVNAEMIKNKIIYKKYQADVNSAIVEENNLVESTYKEMMYEISALSKDPQATQYSHPDSGESKMIDTQRFTEVAEIYKEIERELFSIAQVGMFGLTSGLSANTPLERHPGLMRAIKAYYAQKIGSQYSLQQALRAAHSEASDSQSVALLQKFYKGLMAKGYPEDGALRVMEVVDRLEAEGKREMPQGM
jgi:hypothetical protein